jgi:hypothetical protein
LRGLFDFLARLLDLRPHFFGGALSFVRQLVDRVFGFGGRVVNFVLYVVSGHEILSSVDRVSTRRRAVVALPSYLHAESHPVNGLSLRAVKSRIGKMLRAIR